MFSTTGTWTASGAGNGFNGGSLSLHHRGRDSLLDPHVAFFGSVPESMCGIAAAPATGFPVMPPASYQVTHRFGASTVSIDQNTAPGTWVLLGTYEFELNGPAKVTVTRLTSGNPTVADAVRFVRTGDLSPIVVDNSDLSRFSTTGVWSASGAGNGFNGGSLVSTTVGGTASWTPTLPSSGQYGVYVWYSGGSSNGFPRDASASYQVTHRFGTSTVSIDQNTAPGTWVLLGTYEFELNGPAKVTVTRLTSGNPTVADAVRFVRTGDLSPIVVDNSDLSRFFHHGGLECFRSRQWVQRRFASLHHRGRDSLLDPHVAFFGSVRSLCVV